MVNARRVLSFIFIFVSILFIFALVSATGGEDEKFVTYSVDPSDANIDLYWKDQNGSPLRSIQSLKSYVENKKLDLLFAMNAGMYKPDNSPQGLFVQNFKLFMPLDTASGSGNFYLKPNGVFYINSENKGVVCSTSKFQKCSDKIKYATQSGPMLVVDGEIHPAFKEGSSSIYVRNGVGVLPDNRIVFVMSKKEVNFYSFASYFKTLGCKNALYLDGFVSRTYLPEKNWIQTDGDFGVMIGVTKKVGKK